MDEVALPDYPRVREAILRAWCLHRREGDIVHVEMLTLWEDEAAIRRFAGEDMTLAEMITISTRTILLELRDDGAPLCR